MQRTNTFWAHICLYCIVNAGAFFFYSMAGQSTLVRWTLAFLILFSFFLFAAHFHFYTKKNTLLVANKDAHCLQVEGTLQKEIEAGQKKTQFIRNAYHEVRGNFWGVFIISRMLANASKKGNVKDLNKVLGDLSNGCHNLQLLLSNILDYSKYESGLSDGPNYEATNLRRNLDELIDFARYAAHEKKVTINSHVSDEIPDYVACDRVKFSQVITNLVNNAIKFSNTDSIIEVLFDKDSSERWRISITDQGKGISPALLPHIFEPFVTTKSNNSVEEGLGLGLYITRRLVADLKGEIDVDSKENTGSTFVVTLPIIPFESLSKII